MRHAYETKVTDLLILQINYIKKKSRNVLQMSWNLKVCGNKKKTLTCYL